MRAQNAAEVIAAAAVAEKNVATAAAVETVATLRGRVVKLEGCVAMASGREAAALGEAEAATEEANACRRVAAAAVKDAAARAEVSAKREAEFRVRLEDAVTKASAAEACVVSLEKNADMEHNKWLQFKRDASKREKNLIAEREIGLCEIAGIKTALRRLSKENDKLSSLIGLIKNNGGTVDAVGFHDESKSNSPWRPSGPTPGSAVYQPPSSAKKVSLKGLLRAKSPGRNRSGDSVSPTKGHANASALSFQSPTHSTNNTPVKEPYKEPVSSGRLVAKLEAAERQIVGLTSALANGDESVTKERDALAEKLSKSHREKARVAAEVVRLKTQITDMKATLEARGLERTSVTAALQALHVTYSAVQHDLREQTQNRAASSKVAERYILEVATHEAKVVLLRDENKGLIHELTDMQTKFGVLGRSEAAARVERHQVRPCAFPKSRHTVYSPWSSALLVPCVALPVLVMYVVLATTTYITSALFGPITRTPIPHTVHPADSRLTLFFFTFRRKLSARRSRLKKKRCAKPCGSRKTNWTLCNWSTRNFRSTWWGSKTALWLNSGSSRRTRRLWRGI